MNILELSPENFALYDVRNIKYSKPLKTGSNYIANAKYTDDATIKVTTSKLLCKSGLQIVDNNNAYLELEFSKNDEDLYVFLAELDEYHISKIYDNSKQWFGNQIPLDTIDDFYRPTLRLGRNSKRPMMRLKIPINDGKIVVMNQYKRPLSITEICPNVKIKVTMIYDGLRFLKQQCFSNFTVDTIKVYVPKRNEYQFVENDEFQLFSDAESYEEEQSIIKDHVLEEPVLEEPVLDDPVLEEPVLDDLNLENNDLEENRGLEEEINAKEGSVTIETESENESDSASECDLECCRSPVSSMKDESIDDIKEKSTDFNETIRSTIKDVTKRLEKINIKKKKEKRDRKDKKKVLVTSRKKRIYELSR